MLHKLNCLLVAAIILSAFTAKVYGDTLQKLMMVQKGANASTLTPQFVASSTVPPPSDEVSQMGMGVPFNDTGSTFNNAEYICAYGIWALYNTSYYGIGQESSTMVITLVGTNSTVLDCSKPGQIKGLTQVRSVRYFGNPNATSDGMHIVSEPFLIGGSWNNPYDNPLPSNINGVHLGSLAITGSSAWQICADPDCKYFTCVDMVKAIRFPSLYLIRDVPNDKYNWPRVVRKVQKINAALCPVNPNYRTIWGDNNDNDQFQLEANIVGLDIHEWIPSENATQYS